MGEWKDPNGAESEYESMAVQKVLDMHVEFQIKNNPFVKKAPTDKSYKLIERSSEKIVIRCMNKSRDVPYCDTFFVEEEWYIAGPANPAARCSFFRCSYRVAFVKYTIMKSVIRSNADSEAKEFWKLWT